MINASDLINYYNSISYFLMTCTIKNEAFINQQNRDLVERGYTVSNDPRTWKYYLNLQGEYHSSDYVNHPTITTNPKGPIYIKSLDRVDQYIPFTRTSLQNNFQTKNGYTHNTQNYLNLITAYPDHVDLIKNILYPVLPEDIEDAINANNLTLIRWAGKYKNFYEEQYLEDNEILHIVNDIHEFLDYAYERWYKIWLSRYESAYDPLFWGTLWQHLFCRITVSRIENIHTAFAHSFHIWEYLKSVGLSDYRNVLTNRQTLFLYRNMRHILEHRGKQENLHLLVEELLKEINLTLINRVVRQETISKADLCMWQPEFVPELVRTKNVTTLSDTEPQTVGTIIQRLSDSGHETTIDNEYIQNMKRELGGTPLNYYGTKILEIKSEARTSSKYRNTFASFVLDTLIYFVDNDLLPDTITITDDASGSSTTLTPGDLIIFLNYAAARSVGIAINGSDETPERYTYIEGAYLHNLSVNQLPSTIEFNDEILHITDYIDFVPREPLGNDIDYRSPFNYFNTKLAYMGPVLDVFRPETNNVRDIISTFEVGKENENLPNFTRAVGQLFDNYINRLSERRTKVDGKDLYLLKTLLNRSRTYGNVMVNFTSHDTYTDWFTANATAKTIIDFHENSSNRSASFNNLYTTILSQIIDYDHPSVRFHISKSGSGNALFGRLRDLFIQLCSYNILFIGTSSEEERKWMYFPTYQMLRKSLHLETEEMVYLGDNINVKEHHVETVSELKGYDVNYRTGSTDYESPHNAHAFIDTNYISHTETESDNHMSFKFDSKIVDIVNTTKIGMMGIISTTNSVPSIPHILENDDENLFYSVTSDSIIIHKTQLFMLNRYIYSRLSGEDIILNVVFDKTEDRQIIPEKYSWRISKTELKDHEWLNNLYTTNTNKPTSTTLPVNNNFRDYITDEDSITFINLEPDTVYHIDIQGVRGRARSIFSFSSDFNIGADHYINNFGEATVVSRIKTLPA